MKRWLAMLPLLREVVVLNAMHLKWLAILSVARLLMPIAALMGRQQFFFYTRLRNMNERYRERHDAFVAKVRGH